MNTVILIFLLTVFSSNEMVPPAWEMPADRAPRTQKRYEHDWQVGPRGGEFYWTDHQTKVYRKHASTRQK